HVAQRRVRKPDCAALAKTGEATRKYRFPGRAIHAPSRPVVVSGLGAEDPPGASRGAGGGGWGRRKGGGGKSGGAWQSRMKTTILLGQRRRRAATKNPLSSGRCR